MATNNSVNSVTSAAEFNFVDGVTSAIQTQLNAKAPTASPTFTGTATAAILDVTGDRTGGVMTVERVPAAPANSVYGTQIIQATKSTDMADGFGVAQQFAIEDNAAVQNIIANVQAYRDGADNTGAMSLVTYSAGTPVVCLSAFSDGSLEAKNSLYVIESASALADFAGQGQFWVKNDTPNKPMFTDDAGTDYDLTSPTVTAFTKAATTGAGATNLASLTETNILSFSVPANTLGTNNGIAGKIHVINFRAASSSADPVIRLKYGATTLATITLNTSGDTGGGMNGMIDFMMMANASTSAQYGAMCAEIFLDQDDPDVTTAVQYARTANSGTASEDSTGALTFSVTVQYAVATNGDFQVIGEAHYIK